MPSLSCVVDHQLKRDQDLHPSRRCLAAGPGEVIYSPTVLPRDPMLAFSRPSIGEEEINAVVAVLRSGWITTGPKVAEFEAMFAEQVGARHALALNSGTAALHAALLALGLGEGDEVIVPALTWASSANVVVACGARPVFADIDGYTWNLDPAAVERLLRPATRVVMPVHFGGQPADLGALRAVLAAAGREDIAIVEDAAHAVGAAYRGSPIGGTGRHGTAAACFSFHPIKNITTGEGGMLTTDDDRLAAQAKLWRFHGVQRDAWKAYSTAAQAPPTYDVVLPGYKYNLTDLAAALGIEQLRKLPAFNGRRAEIAGRYLRELANVPNLVLPGLAAYDCVHPWHLFPVLPPERASFMARLRTLGIGTGLHFEAVHLHSYYRQSFATREGQCPVAEEVCARIVSLPLFPAMSEDDVTDVVGAVRETLAQAA
jgi:dTDP-4-amino-4,6-dideoxygalactose transaminase